MIRSCLAALICSGPLLSLPLSAQVLNNPPTFTSGNHVLDLLVIARPSTIHLGSFSPTAWVYEICPTSVASSDQCPAGSPTAAPYGGVVLQLKQGDHLRMRLVNHLPPAPPDAEHAHGPDAMMNEMLMANPTNIHTHGLIVEPRKADAADPTYGDYVYVLGYPAGKLPAMVDPDLTATDQPLQYDIYIPENHPSGFFYFHPHVHGLGVNQLAEGLSGIISIGSLADYASTAGSFSPSFNANLRYFAIKDMQVLANGNVQDQEDPEFCSPVPGPHENRNGGCPGLDQSNNPDDMGGGNYSGGRWFFSVNGQVYPTVNVDRQHGEVWRMLNASPTRSYDLVLQNDQNHARVLFQVISLDGVALAPPPNTDVSTMAASVGGRFQPVPCPGPKLKGRTSEAVCTSDLVMFPSSRAEVWIPPFQAGHVSSATLATTEFSTGSAGDDWPSANLAHLNFTGSANAAANTLNIRPARAAALASTGALGGPVHAMFPGISTPIPIADARAIASGKSNALPFALANPQAQQVRGLTPHQLQQIGTRLNAMSQPVASIASANCSALPAGHRRRIFFGVPSNNPDGFGFGYEEVDARGKPVPGTFEDIAEFDPAHINVCLPLAPNNQTVTETWELVNVAGEAHNFHMHQTKFLVLPRNAPAGDGGTLMDNVPLPSGSQQCDGSVATWRSGTCKVPPVYVAIPFSEVGDYVYHCHIGEHQDGGMMAHIRIIANP